MLNTRKVRKWISPVARIGLVAKGIVYCLLGVLAFMAAFELGGQSAGNTDKQGVLNLVNETIGGKILLAIIAAGLLCFSIWRFVQGIADTGNKGKSAKGMAVRARYILSGLIYLSFTAVAAKMVIGTKNSGGGNSNQEMASKILAQPFGKWLLVICALILVGVGIYQMYFGLSEKFRKYVSNLPAASGSILLRAGQVGYIARGFVWLIVGYLLMRGAFRGSSANAGDTSKAFEFLKSGGYGAYLLVAVALGLICYGVFNFIRAKYDSFNN